MKVFAKVLVIAALVLVVALPVSAASDIQGHWAEATIRTLMSNNIISGYPDGTYKPNNATTKGEFAALLSRALGISGESTIQHWAGGAIQALRDVGAITGEYKPDQPISRVEMAEILIKGIGIEPLETDTPFIDVNNIYASVAYFEYLIRGYKYPHGIEFGPDRTLTRAEVAAIISNIMEYIKDPHNYKIQRQQAETEQQAAEERKKEELLARVEELKNDKETIIRELKAYPIINPNVDTLEESHNLAMGSKYYGPRKDKFYTTAKGIMETFYNRDYRTIGKDWADQYIYYFNNKEEVNGEWLHPRNYMNYLVEQTKKDKVIVEMEFVSDPILFYIHNVGISPDSGVRVRGRAFFIYHSHNNPPEGVQVGNWYWQDYEVLLEHCTTNLNPDWKYSEQTYKDVLPLNKPQLIK